MYENTRKQSDRFGLAVLLIVTLGFAAIGLFN